MSFQVAGIPIQVRGDFLVMVAILGAVDPRRMQNPPLLGIWVGVVFVSIIWHELGHALAFRRFGHRPRITLFGMGGMTMGDAGRATSPGQHLLISLAGPAAGLALGGASWLVSRATGPPASEIGQVLVSDLLWVNIGWSIINLLPMLPLDGGNAMRSVLRLVLRKDPPADVATAAISSLVAAAAIALAFRVGSIWIGFLGVMFLVQNVRMLLDIAKLRSLEQIARNLDAGDLDGAAVEAQSLAVSASAPRLRLGALWLLANARWRQGRHVDVLLALDRAAPYYAGKQAPATTAVETTPPGTTATAAAAAGHLPGDVTYLLCGSLSRTGYTAEALDVARRWFERAPRPRAALAAASALALEGERDEAVGWLRRAVDAGLDQPGSIADDPDLAGLRHHPEVVELIRRVSERVTATADPLSSPSR